MASTISNTGITNGGRITADQITQVTNALTGTEAYNITISGSLNINNAPITNLTASGNISSSGTIISSNLSGTNTGDQDLSPYVLSSNTASFAITSSNVLFANITGSNISASGAISAFGSSSLHGLPTSKPTITGSLWLSGSAGEGSKYLVVFTG